MATTSLDDKVKDLSRTIDSLRSDASTKWAAFDKLRGELAASEADLTNPDGDAFRQADEAHRAYNTVADQISQLESQRDRLFELTTAGGAAAETRHDNRVPESREVETWGARVAEIDAYKQAVANRAFDHFTGQVRLGEVASRAELHAIITGAAKTSAGAFISPDRRGFVERPNAPLFVMDLVTVSQTDSDVVEYVRETGFTNNAAPVAEATKDGPISATAPIVTAVEAGLKPQSALAFEVVQASVKTLAHWIPATRRALSDAAMVRSYIDGRLRFGLQIAFQAQMLTGSGTGENLLGVLNTPGVQSQTKGSDSYIDALHKAMTKVRLAYIEPTAHLIHPTDWEAISLAKDSTGQYLMGHPAQANAATLWGIPVVAQAAVPQGNPVVGDWRQAEVWLREGVEVLASDSHVDFFTRNIVALLAEMRAAFGVAIPEAFCEVV